MTIKTIEEIMQKEEEIFVNETLPEYRLTDEYQQKILEQLLPFERKRNRINKILEVEKNKVIELKGGKKINTPEKPLVSSKKLLGLLKIMEKFNVLSLKLEGVEVVRGEKPIATPMILTKKKEAIPYYNDSPAKPKTLEEQIEDSEEFKLFKMGQL